MRTVEVDGSIRRNIRARPRVLAIARCAVKAGSDGIEVDHVEVVARHELDGEVCPCPGRVKVVYGDTDSQFYRTKGCISWQCALHWISHAWPVRSTTPP